MKINLLLKSKAKKSLLKTILLIKNYLNKMVCKKTIKNINNLKIVKQKIVLLRSPHVNKSAQTKFCCILFKTRVDLNLNNFIKLNIVLKKINENLLHDINFVMKFKLLKKIKLNIFIIFFFIKKNKLYYTNIFFKKQFVSKNYISKIIKIIKIIKLCF